MALLLTQARFCERPYPGMKSSHLGADFSWSCSSQHPSAAESFKAETGIDLYYNQIIHCRTEEVVSWPDSAAADPEWFRTGPVDSCEDMILLTCSGSNNRKQKPSIAMLLRSVIPMVAEKIDNYAAIKHLENRFPEAGRRNQSRIVIYVCLCEHTCEAKSYHLHFLPLYFLYSIFTLFCYKPLDLIQGL